MADVGEALRQNRAAVDEFLADVDRMGAEWAAPRAPGKWSPAQLTEHVARALEQSGKVIAGQPSVFPTFPIFLRPVMRGLFFNSIVKTGRFPGSARTNKPMDPEGGPATPAEGRQRLQTALGALEAATRAHGPGDQKVNTTTFGRVTLHDYVLFQAHHTRHHRAQLGVGAKGREWANAAPCRVGGARSPFAVYCFSGHLCQP